VLPGTPRPEPPRKNSRYFSLADDGSRAQRAISVATRSGKVPPRVDWSISNPSVVSITSRGPAVDVRALSAGRALITARVNGRAVTASITVDDADLRLGTARWLLPRMTGLTPRALLDASRVDDDGADLFAVDADR